MSTTESYFVAKYDYEPENAEVGGEHYLSFKEGEVIRLTGDPGEGWLRGSLNGKEGLFPANFVAPSDAHGHDSSSPVVGETTADDDAQLINRDMRSRPSDASPPTAVITAPPSAVAAAAVAAAAVPAVVPPPAATKSTPPPVVAAAMSKPPAAETKTAPPPAATTAATSSAAPRAAAIEVKKDNSAKVGREVERKPKTSLTKFGPWASNMALISGWTMVMLGICSIVWGVVDQIKWGAMYVADGLYSILVGFGVLGWEYWFGGTRYKSRFPWRFVIYLTISGFLFVTLTTMISAFFLLTSAVINLLACLYNEEYEDTRIAPKRNRLVFDDQVQGFCGKVKQWFVLKREENKLSAVVFLALYVAGNIALFVVVVLDWFRINSTLAPDARLSGWGPFAKGFGNLLDLNCALIVLPVCRTMLRWLYNTSTADQSCCSRFWARIMEAIPLDRALSFHRMTAKVILFATAGHVFTHFINYALRPSQTLAKFGVWPWVSGAIVMYAMLFMYSSAHDNTKRGQFEVFWYSHHLFVIFFILLLLHGQPGYGPNFWKWFVGPGGLYLIERILRWRRSQKDVILLSATFLSAQNGANCDVLALSFDKVGVFSEPYRRGQYIFLMSPSISRFEWHPFTISSAPEQDSVTVHIKVMGPGSWTRRLWEYLDIFRAGKVHVELDRIDNGERKRGKIFGPTGVRLFCIDGPHSAPTQHTSRYETALIVGAGIGVTPVAATLKSIVLHSWRDNIGKSFPNSAYFSWICGHADVDAFRWLVRLMKEAQDQVVHMRATQPQDMAGKHFAIHVFITSVPKDVKPIDLTISEQDDTAFWGLPRQEAHIIRHRAPFSELDLYKAMKNPPKHIQFGDIHIYNGRPAWEEIFREIADTHPTGDVGVAFCGNPMIAKDLSLFCNKYSHNRKGGYFKLHKENF